jgi:hypothetical protein
LVIEPNLRTGIPVYGAVEHGIAGLAAQTDKTGSIQNIGHYHVYNI